LKNRHAEKVKVAALRARTIIREITTFRTDLNQFSTEEKTIIESCGYTLASLRYRLYCASLFSENKPHKVERLYPFAPEFDLKIDYVERNLKGSNNVFYANIFRHLLVRSKSYIEKNKEALDEIVQKRSETIAKSTPEASPSGSPRTSSDQVKTKKKKSKTTKDKKVTIVGTDHPEKDEPEKKTKAEAQPVEKMAKQESKEEDAAPSLSTMSESLSKEEIEELQEEKKRRLDKSAEINYEEKKSRKEKSKSCVIS